MSTRVLALCIAVSMFIGIAAFVAVGEPVAMLIPLGILVGLYILSISPIRATLLSLFAIVLTVSDPHEVPFAGQWSAPLDVVGAALYANLHKLTKIPILRFSGLEAAILLLIGLIFYRKATKQQIDEKALRVPKALQAAVLLSFWMLILSEIYGMMNGGDFKESLFQFRAMAMAMLVCYLGMYALRGVDDIRIVNKIIIYTAIYRITMGAYFYYIICPQLGYQPPHVTTHTDTVLFVLAIVAVVAHWWEAPGPRRLFEMALVSGYALWGIVLNDRRLAYVTLILCLGGLFLLSPWNRARRFVSQVAIVMMPLILAYIGIGWGSGSSVFKPVRYIKSVVSPDTSSDEDESTNFRHLENYNLVQTWSANPLVGSGFGHEFDEVIMLPDISQFMANYRFQPHNNVLWLVGIFGAIGFTLHWLYLGIAVFFASRGYHRAVNPEVRATFLVAVAAIIAYLNQAYGDMGVNSYTASVPLAIYVALGGQMSIQVGAWKIKGARRV